MLCQLFLQNGNVLARSTKDDDTKTVVIGHITKREFFPNANYDKLLAICVSPATKGIIADQIAKWKESE